jgi:hypothetical protein
MDEVVAEIVPDTQPHSLTFGSFVRLDAVSGTRVRLRLAPAGTNPCVPATSSAATRLSGRTRVSGDIFQQKLIGAGFGASHLNQVRWTARPVTDAKKRESRGRLRVRGHGSAVQSLLNQSRSRDSGAREQAHVQTSFKPPNRVAHSAGRDTQEGHQSVPSPTPAELTKPRLEAACDESWTCAGVVMYIVVVSGIEKGDPGSDSRSPNVRQFVSDGLANCAKYTISRLEICGLL